MIAFGYIIFGLAGVSLALWLAQTARSLNYFRTQVNESWDSLRKALAARREIVPYVVAAVHTEASQVVDVIGNACDLADHVATVRECAQAEARLTSALNRLFASVDADPAAKESQLLGSLRRRLEDQYTRVLMHKDMYNRQVETLNTLLDRGGARLFVRMGIYHKAELF